MVILGFKLYLVLVVLVMITYAIYHYRYTVNRLWRRQRLYYQDILDPDLPCVSVLVPMHNEQRVAEKSIRALLDCDYPEDRLEIIPIDDHSTDGTGAILDGLAAAHGRVRPLRRRNGARGKPAALNDGLAAAQGEIVMVFDADYRPSRGALRDLAITFRDPEVGAVMGRVVPWNAGRSLLTRLLDLERSGGYQVAQQARHTLGLIPQYGGTVGGFRRDIVRALGGFDLKVLAEDTDLTFDLAARGWKVVYANRVECHEEVPETWQVRSRQIRRWSRGHNQVLFKRLVPILRSRYLSAREKRDGFMLLMTYTIPVFLLTGIIDSVVLFFAGEMEIVPSVLMVLFVVAYNAFGNCAPFYQIGTAALLDGGRERIRLLPLLLFYFLLNIWNVSVGFFEALVDRIAGRTPVWQKTARSTGTAAP